MKRLMLAWVMILCLAAAIAIAEPDENIRDTWFAARSPLKTVHRTVFRALRTHWAARNRTRTAES